MTTGFELDVELLHRHGGRVAEISTSVAQAAVNGRSEPIAGSAFGVMCASVGAVVRLFADAIDHAMRTTSDELESSADGVRAMVTAYRASDERAIDALRRLTP